MKSQCTSESIATVAYESVLQKDMELCIDCLHAEDHISKTSL